MAKEMAGLMAKEMAGLMAKEMADLMAKEMADLMAKAMADLMAKEMEKGIQYCLAFYFYHWWCHLVGSTSIPMYRKNQSYIAPGKQSRAFEC